MKRGGCKSPPRKVDETLKVYIGVVESEIEYGECRDSIQNILIREGDIQPVFIRATKGYEARQQHFNNWLHQTDCEAMLLLDGDMIFPKDTLEKLRSHNLPYVSGAYLRRTYAPPAPVWFEDGNTFPYKPATEKFEPDKLYKIGASGWGCILIHRQVAEAVQPLLKGEQFVIEDDLDVYPYDLRLVMSAISELDAISSGRKPYDEYAVRECVEILISEIRPLRGVKDLVGSDIRFPFFAKMAGFDLWLDTGVMCGHMLNYQLHPYDYINTPDETVKGVSEKITESVIKETERLQQALKFEETQQAEGVNPSEAK